MTLIWLKRILVCSTATLTGSYLITSWPKHKIKSIQQQDEKYQQDDSSYIYPSGDKGIDFDESLESVAIFRRKSHHLPTYWKLLMLCKSKDSKVRRKAVESLSKLINLEKWEYVTIAQASDINTAIGLARNLNTGPHFFLPPPFRDLEKGNLQKELCVMLSSLQFTNTDICIQYLIREAVKTIKILMKCEYNVDLEVGDPFVIYHSQQKKNRVLLYDKLCLETLLVCSTSICNRNLMLDKQILKLLLKVLKYHKNDTEIHSLIAQILANLAMDKKVRNHIYMTGWLGILSEWKKSPHINISLPAAKALANLDNDDVSNPLYDDGVYLLSPTCQLGQVDISADVIFIHGLLGATFWTWRQSDSQRSTKIKPAVKDGDMENVANLSQYSMCWPKDWLSADIPSLRILSVDYKTSVSKWMSYCPEVKEKDYINNRAKELMDKLLLSGVGERPIIWVAHSMGGLIVKHILAESFESRNEKSQSFLKKTAGIVFYSVPHKGTDLASKMNSVSILLQPSSSIAELKKGDENLSSLHQKFKEIISRYDIPILSFGETKKSRWGLSSILVPLDSANPDIGEFFTLPVDHLSTCKPTSSKSPEYLKVLNFLQMNLPEISSNERHSFQAFDIIFEISKVMCLIP